MAAKKTYKQHRPTNCFIIFRNFAVLCDDMERRDKHIAVAPPSFEDNKKQHRNAKTIFYYRFSFSENLGLKTWRLHFRRYLLVIYFVWNVVCFTLVCEELSSRFGAFCELPFDFDLPGERKREKEKICCLFFQQFNLLIYCYA